MILAVERPHPNPNGPFPLPESYERERFGAKSARLGLVAIVKDTNAVPVEGLTSNFSPIPLMEPPPFGREIEGIEELGGAWEGDLVVWFGDVLRDPMPSFGFAPSRLPPEVDCNPLWENISFSSIRSREVKTHFEVADYTL